MLLNRNKRRGWAILPGTVRRPPGPLRYFFIAVRTCVILLAIIWASGDKDFRDMCEQLAAATRAMVEHVEKETSQQNQTEKN